MRGRILVIDDEIAMARAMARVLSSDHEVVIETRGAVALARLLKDDQFNVIFCDLMMPDMSGMELYEALYRAKSTLTSRIVFVTGGAFTHQAQEFLDTVSNVTMTKPFEPGKLRAIADAQMQAPPDERRPGGS